MSTTGNRSGFTLIEVLVAVTILSIGVVAIMQAFSVSLDALRRSHDVVRASDVMREQLAEAEMTAILGQKLDPVYQGRETAPEGGMVWQTTVVPVPDASVSDLPGLKEEIQLQRVLVKVWRDTGGREYQVTTCVIPWPKEEDVKP
jgi:type II secretion system protein I